MKKYPSIFNDALAPVTPGPSSSNTCGPSRIARVCRQLFGRQPKKLTVDISTKGNLIISYLGMRTDMAFLNGALGRTCTHERFIHAFEDAKAAGIEMESRFREDLPGFPTHMAILTMEDEEQVMRFKSASVGGGAFLIEEVNGCPIKIEGDHEELLVFTDLLTEDQLFAMKTAAHTLPGFNDVAWAPGTDFGILNVKTDTPVLKEQADALAAMPGGRFWRSAGPELDVVSSASRKPPFETTAEMVEYADRTGLPLWKLAVRYEMALSGWSEEQVMGMASSRWSVIVDSIRGGFKPGNDMNGIVQACAPQVKDAFSSGTLIPMGMVDVGAPISLAIMEYSNCSGVITCIPTGGSSGVVPGALCGAAKTMGKTEDDVIKALLVAGLMGTFMEPTKYLGALGCQAEIGCAAGMAAAGLVALMDGNARQACCAAVMSIQSLMGLLCDKIGGLVQVPCLSRNMTAVSIAATCANATMAGVESLVPLEETIASMLKSGSAIRDNGINRMGACWTATGCRLTQEQKERNKNLR